MKFCVYIYLVLIFMRLRNLQLKLHFVVISTTIVITEKQMQKR